MGGPRYSDEHRQWAIEKKKAIPDISAVGLARVFKREFGREVNPTTIYNWVKRAS